MSSGAADDARRDRVLVLSLSELALDARVLRQVEFLATRFDVSVAAFGNEPELPPGVAFVELPVSQTVGAARSRAEAAGRLGLRLAGSYNRAYWLDARVRRWKDELGRLLPVDAVVVNDLFALPLARAAAGDTPLVFDAHEHWSSESASWTRLQRISMRQAHAWIVDHHVPRTAGMMTVSRGIAREFARRTGARPRLVTSAPFFHDLRPSPVSSPVRLIHVGVADERRRLEDTIEAVRSLEGRFSLDLVLLRDNRYRRHLERLVAAEPLIRILPPVPSRRLVSFANDYDVGVFLLPQRYPNQVHVLPNKLFDYIQARLAVAIGPSPEMAEVVSEWDCGVVSSSFEAGAFAEALEGLTAEEIARMKANADRAAHVLTAEANRDTVVSLVDSAIAHRIPMRAGG